MLAEHAGCWVIGGGAVYAAFLPHADRLVVTETRALASVPRLLPWGAVAGFRLEGFAGPGASSAVPEGPAPHSCPAGPWTVVAGSAQRTEEPGGPVLKVVHDGVQHDLLVPGAGTPS